MVDDEGNVIRLSDVRRLQKDMADARRILASTDSGARILQHDYSVTGHLIDRIYTGLAFKTIASDLPQFKCRYKPIKVPNIGTDCEGHEGLAMRHGICTHPPWQGDLVIDNIVMLHAHAYYSGLFSRASSVVWASLRAMIDSVLPGLSFPWDRVEGNPWGSGQFPPQVGPPPNDSDID